MKHVIDRIPAWLAGELEPAVADRVAAHLQDCPDCAREAASIRGILDILTQADTDPDLRSSVWPQVQERTFGRGRSPNSWFFGTGPLTRTAWASAAVAAGLLVGVLLPGGGAVTPDDAAADAALETLWLAESSWVDDGSGLGLTEIWLTAGQDEEGDGS
jgi:anti-sigma factor RsiW